VRASSRFRLRAHVRRFNRLRWWGKLRNVRRHRGRGRMSRRAVVRYVLWSPELGDYSFEPADRHALIEFASRALNVEATRVRELFDELDSDEQLRRDIDERRRPTLLDKNPPVGQRRLWYVVARLIRPALIVETGVWYGLGSAVLLRALERNADEGYEGRLLAFDPDPTAGWLVHPRHHPRWTLVRDTAEAGLEAHLHGKLAGLFVVDTPPAYERERRQFELAVAHAASPAVLLASNGSQTAALRDLCREYSLAYHHLPYESADHFYTAPGVSLAVVRDAGSRLRSTLAPSYGSDEDAHPPWNPRYVR
jgi:Methyltransferase domain